MMIDDSRRAPFDDGNPFGTPDGLASGGAMIAARLRDGPVGDLPANLDRLAAHLLAFRPGAEPYFREMGFGPRITKPLVSVRLLDGDVLELAGRKVALSPGWAAFFRALLYAHATGEPLPLGAGRVLTLRRAMVSKLRRGAVKRDLREVLAALPGPLLDPEEPRLNPAVEWDVEIG